MTGQKSIRLARLLVSTAVPLALLLVSLVVLGSQATPVYAASVRVDDEGTDSPTCGGQDTPCRTIPYALANRAETGDTVVVSAGTYTEAITLRAGIVISGAGATRTFIDGEGVRGPMVTASGSAIGPSTVLRGVTVRRGIALNGGGVNVIGGASPLIESCIVSENIATSSGGGLYVFGSTFTLRDTDVISNGSASHGGGMYQTTSTADSRLDLSGGRFENNESTGGNGGGLFIDGTVVMTGTGFINNSADQYGGGIYQSGAAEQAELIGGLLEGNTASVFYGGGLHAQGTAILSATQVASNTANARGGGVWAGHAQVTGAVFANNWAGQVGGGLFADWDVVMTGTSMISNTASVQGGGIAALRDADIVNSLFARNSAYAGAAVWMWGDSPVRPRLRHLTIVSPTVGSAYPTAAAILVHNQATATITNTIVVGYPYAIEAYEGGTAYEDYNLYYGLGTAALNETGGSVYSGGHSLYGLDPCFVDPSSDDYHLGAGSAAIGAGLDIGVATDIDGDPRVAGFPPDIGADETAPILAVSKSGPAWFNLGDSITYILSVTNTGVVTAYNVILTDAIPIGASFVSATDGGSESAGEVSWPPFDIAPGGGVVNRTFSIDAIETIINHDYMATAQGYHGVAGAPPVTSVANHPPVADAGDPQTRHTGTVTLDGSGSSDPDGDSLVYHWTQTGGAPVTLSSPNVASPTFTAPTATGLLNFTLTVTDSLGLHDSDTTSVTIANTAPSADAGVPQTVHVGTVTLDGSGSADPDGDSLIYHWTQTGGAPVTLSSPNVASPTFTAPTSMGLLNFALTVTDPFGLQGSETAAVTVANMAPSADAGPAQLVLPGALVFLDGSGSSDPDGDSLVYHWTQTGGAPVTISEPSAVGPSFTAPVNPGILTFSLTITDPFGVDDIDHSTVTAALPELAISKSGPSEVMDGDFITYTLAITNSASIAASSVVITDALPVGATFIKASNNGTRVGDVVSWTVPNLEPGGSLIRTFTITATRAVTNAYYRVSSAEGVSADGTLTVVTEVKPVYRVYLPIVARER